MPDKNAVYLIDGLKVKLYAYERNYHYSLCNKKQCEWGGNVRECVYIHSSKHCYNLHPETATELVACVAIFHVANCNDESHTYQDRCVYMYDNTGESYEANITEPCDEIRKNRKGFYDALPPKSVNKVYAYFPELPADRTIAKFVWVCDEELEEESAVFEVGDTNRDVLELLTTNKMRLRVQDYEEFRALRDIDEMMPKLDSDVSTLRIGQHTLSDEREQIAAIETRLFEMRKLIDAVRCDRGKAYKEWLEQKQRDFKRVVEDIERHRRQTYKYQEIAASLYQLEPRDFEIWCGDLFRALGYEVEVTRYVGDEGIDIYLWKDGIQYAVQCKRWKNPISLTDVSKFYQDMKAQNIDHGIFMGSGLFYPNAKIFCKSKHILILDQYCIAELLEQLDTEK